MVKHADMHDDELRRAIHHGIVVLAGNSRLRIFGKLRCASGMRMKKENRVFFASKKEALQHGYRPCGHCLHKEYKDWRNGTV